MRETAQPRERSIPWWVGVLALALAARLAYLLVLREPLLQGDQFGYLFGALRIAAHEDPLGYVARHEEWRSWGVRWTRAPLYPLFASLPLRLLGPQLLPLQILNAALGALAALQAGALGRRAAGRLGTWAGVAQALYWPAIELTPKTLSENLHAPLLLAALAALARSVEPEQLGHAAWGGFLLGLSALARTVSAAFVPLAALWRYAVAGGRKGLLAALLVGAGAGGAILPWTLRNVWFGHQVVLIDNVGLFNLWKDNLYEAGPDLREGWPFRRGRAQAVPQVAPRTILRGIAANPAAFASKVWGNLGHLVRPEGLHLLLDEEHTQPAWRHALAIVLDDGLLLVSLSLLPGFLLARRGSAARGLILGWLGYYAFMLVVVFHVEIRYRSVFVPLLFVAALGGAAALADRSQLGGPRRSIAVALLVLPTLLLAAGYGNRALCALSAQRHLEDARAALARGDRQGGAQAAANAASRDPGSARPWLAYGAMLARAGAFADAIDAYERAAQRRPDHPLPRLVMPQLLSAAGRESEVPEAARQARLLALRRGPWLALDLAWRALPAPRTDEVLLPDDEHGAARGFHHPRGGTRWTGPRAWLRLEPRTPASEYELTLELGSPDPAPLPDPTVELRVTGGPSARFVLGRAIQPYRLRVPAAATHPLVVEIRAPAWLKIGLMAELGVAVKRMAVAPLG